LCMGLAALCRGLYAAIASVKLLHFLCVLFPTVPPIGFIAYMINRSSLSMLQTFVFGIYLAFIIILIGLGVALVDLTNADSISGMVAQRFKRISYGTILAITGVACYTSCLIVCGGIVRQKLGNTDEPAWRVIVGSLSPLFTASILVFPIVVRKTPQELGMTPLVSPLAELVDHAADPAADPANRTYKMSFYSFSEGWHDALHFGGVATGLATGYVSVGHYLTHDQYNFAHSLQIALMAISAVCCVLFLIGGKLRNAEAGAVVPLYVKRFVLLVEYVGLYYYMILMITSTVVAGNILS